jgi:hypothetical protein
MNETTTIERSRSAFTPTSRKPPRRLFAKGLSVNAIAAMRGRSVEMIVGERYRNSNDILATAQILTRSATGITTTADLTSTIVAEFQAGLAPGSAVAQLRQLGHAYMIDRHERIVVPSRAAPGAPGRAAWVGETGAIPVIQCNISAGVLVPTKLSAIATFSEELLSASNGQIEAALHASIAEEMGLRADETLASNDPASDTRPAGLLNGVATIPSVDQETDLAALAATMVAAQARIPTLVLNPAQLAGAWTNAAFAPQLAQGRLGAFAVAAGYGIPAGTVIALDAAQFAGALGEPIIDASRVATLVMADADDTAPTHAIDAAGVIDTPGEVGVGLGIPVAGAPAGAGAVGALAMNMFQTWGVALRVITPTSWSMMRSGAVAAVTGAAW